MKDDRGLIIRYGKRPFLFKRVNSVATVINIPKISARNGAEWTAPQTRSIRRYPRFYCPQAASIEIAHQGGFQPAMAKIRDISLGGACLESERPLALAPGDTARFLWRIPPGIHFPFVAELGKAHPSKKYKFSATVSRAESSQHVHQYAIKFTRLIPEQIEQIETRSYRWLTALVGVLIAAGICVLRISNVRGFWYHPLMHSYSLAVCSYVFARIGLSLFYRQPSDVGFQPHVSIIIPVKNEQIHIAETVRHCFDARYPMDRLEVIVVDDGSTDETPKILKELQAEFPDLRVFHFAENKGKRHAMASGAEKAQGEILICVDSDSLIDPEAIYRIVQPFLDPSIGAVAGNVKVAVDPSNPFSKMESVRYHVSQRVIRASESFFGTVTCCSGAFAAYRRDIVLNVLPHWLNQRFLGAKATFGDDRSLTNCVLKTHRVVYHHGASCQTYVPNTWRCYLRQQLRWKKSWARESFIASPFMIRHHPLNALMYFTGIVLTLLSPWVALRALAYMPITQHMSFLPYLLGLMLVNLLFACDFFYHTRSRDWIYILAFVVLYIGFLCWQTYYAILTIPKNHWGTR